MVILIISTQKTLKTSSVHIVDPLVHICNLCIDKTTWLDALKIAEVIPIHKSEEKHSYQLQTYFTNLKYRKNFRKNYTQSNY